MQTRFSFGGDEHIFAEVDEAMSLEAFFKSLFITNAVRDAKIKGVTEICPANASYQVKFDPDLIKPDDMLAELKRLDSAAGSAEPVIATRIIEIPVLYDDPWTNETLMRFRERHQDPNSTDLEYAARINHLDGVDAFIKAHSSAPWFVSMVGFVAGLPFLYQMVERKRQLQAPKYLRPRTDTPKLTVGHGGCFSCIYSVRGAGGYQMFGITPMPIYDPNQKISYLRDFMCLFKPGDIVKWKPIDRAAYDAAVADVDAAASRPPSAMSRSRSPNSIATSTVTIASSRGSSMAIKVLKPGLATTVQDLGRPGYYHIGIPLSGGMDRHALAAANLLVGNEEGAAVLEAVFMGPELEFTDDAVVAVTGAELPPKLDGAPRATWTSFKVKRGQKLTFDFLKKGARAYIAVAGGIDVPVVLGSRSTYALGALGGFQGRTLEAGDELPVGAATAAVKEGRTVGEDLRGLPAGMPTELRVIPGLTGIASPTPPARASFPTPGRSRRKPTGSVTASRAASR